ncbi:MNT3 Probable mannosyltransferase MNT3 [Candida maltosa Xu316]
MLRHLPIFLIAILLFVFPFNLDRFIHHSQINSPKPSQCYQYTSDHDFKTYLQSTNTTHISTNLCIEKPLPTPLPHRENATMLMLCRNSDIYSVLETITNIQDRFNKNHNYDYTFLNDEPFNYDFIYLVTNHIPYARINFGIIPHSHWSYPDHINMTQVDIARETMTDVPYGDSVSYRFMCRYFSGFFYKHEFMREYRYYWRIEPGVRLLCDVRDDLFMRMREKGKVYGFVISLFEYVGTIPTLWESVVEFIEMKRQVKERELVGMVVNEFGWFNLCHFWTNFEIADLEFFRSEEYEEFFQFLDAKGGFFYERWGDAPIHTIAVALLLQKKDLIWFDDVGYYHPPYLQCPRDISVYLQNKCTCDPNLDFTMSDLSCTNHFVKFI